MRKSFLILFMGLASYLTSVVHATVPCFQHLVGPAASAPTEEPFTWSSFARSWKRSMEQAFYEDVKTTQHHAPLLPRYQQAAKDGDARIGALTGLKFDFSRIEKGEVGIPELGEVVAVVKKRVDDGLAAEKLSPKRKLLPGVLVRDAAGNYIPLPYGEERKDVFYVDVSGDPNLFTLMLKANLFPITCNVRARHDLFHLKGISENLDYMAGIQELAEDFGQRNHPMPLRDRYIRFFNAYESYGFLPAEKRPQLIPLLSSVFAEGKVGAGVRAVYEELIGQDEARLVAETKALLLFALRESVLLGGASEIGLSYLDHEIQDGLAAFLRNLRRALLNYEVGKLEGRLPAERPDRIRYLAIHRARLEAGLFYSTYLTPKLFFRDLVKEKPPEKSPLYVFYVGSGISTTGYRLPDGGTRSLMGLSLRGELTDAHRANFGPLLKLPAAASTPANSK